MVQLSPDVVVTERQETSKRLVRMCVGDTLDELMDSADGIRPHVLRGVVEHEAQNHVVQRF